LLELVLTTTIIAIVSAIAIPRFSAAIQRQRVTAAAQRIAADFNLARTRANTTSTTVTVTFAFASNQYQVSGVADLDKPLSTYTVNLLNDPYRVTLVSSDLSGTLQTSGTSQVSFSGYGLPSAGGTITVAAGTATKRVTVDSASGKAQVN
jgi:Tfp pilus assembly protein FimT